jgi:predicted flap endonuclease-1-like 5' DNA nuclease
MRVFLFALLTTVAAVLLWAIWAEAFVDGLIFTLGLVTTALCGYLVADYFFTSEKKNLLSDIDMNKREVSALREEADILRKQASLSIPQSEIDELRRRMQTAEDERAKIHGEFLAQAANISSLNTRLNALQKKYDRLNEDSTINTETRSTELDAIRDTLSASKAKLKELANENAMLKMELERYHQNTQKQVHIEAPVSVEMPIHHIPVEMPIQVPIQGVKEESKPIEIPKKIETKLPTLEISENTEGVDDNEVVFLYQPFGRMELESHRSRSRSVDENETTPMHRVTPVIQFTPSKEWAYETEDHGISETSEPEPNSSSNSHSMESLPEDLKIVEGIGPKIELLLKESGIKGLKDLSAVPVENLKEILAKGGSRYRLNDPTSWPEQARLLMNGEMDKLKTFTTDLFKNKKI